MSFDPAVESDLDRLKSPEGRRRIARALLFAGIVVATAAALAIVASVAVTFFLFGADPTQIPFEPTEWRIASPTESETRWRMTDDLRAHYGLVGKTPDEVRQLLGPSSFSEDHLEYMLRDRSFVGFSADFLVLWLGADGRVSRVGVVLHSY